MRYFAQGHSIVPRVMSDIVLRATAPKACFVLFHKSNSADQTMWMCSLVCVYVVRMYYTNTGCLKFTLI